MPELSEEILAEILLRLPVKSLARFKCVSKQWRSQISDTHFTRSQLQGAMSRNPCSVARVLLTSNPLQSISTESLCRSDSEAPPTTVLEFPVRVPQEEFGFDFVGSCDGLLCVLADSESLVLWNPTTRECTELPSSGFAPSNVEFFYGFGYDSQTNDYKLVRGHYVAATGRSDSNVTSIEIFSVKTNSWRRVEFEGIELQSTSLGKYAAGSLHWLVTGAESKPTNRVVSFDLSGEKFHETVPLTGIDDYETVPLEGIGVSGERLFAYRGDGNGSGTHFDAWVMKWDGEEPHWTKSCHVPRDVLPYTKYWLNLVDIREDGKVVFDSAGWELCVYDSDEGGVRTFEFDNEWEFFGCATYVESLVSPHTVILRGDEVVQKGQ